MNPSDSDASRFKSATTDRRGERDLDDLLEADRTARALAGEGLPVA